MDKRDETVVETKSGKIKGEYQGNIYIFKGIPYAAPPVGEGRWLPPAPVKPWTGVRPARTYGPKAPQDKAPWGFMAGFDLEEPQSEDCLYLNIWSPGTDGSRRPVLVWIHGGAFNRGSGSSPTYSGTGLAQRGDVVVVTINYRLGPLGFLHLKRITGGKIPATGNEGLLDQIAALKWVRDNIAVFGGDPENITVFGESAGGMSIGCLLAMPRARGLFHKAILQSGSNTTRPLDQAVLQVEQFLEVLGLRSGDVAALRSLTVEELLSAHQEFGKRLDRKGAVLEPVIDGETLPDMPIEAVKRGSADRVVIMAGSNLEEAKFMAKMNQDLTRVDEAGLLRRWQQVLPPELVPGLIEKCRRALAKTGVASGPAEIALALQTDVQFRIPALRLIEAQRGNNRPAYSYLFTWRSPAPDMGACHALEIGFVFGNMNPKFNGAGLEADRLSRNIQDAWLAFARTGNPSCESLGKWPVYGSDRETMILGEKCYVAEAPYDDERRAWDPVPNKFLG